MKTKMLHTNILAAAALAGAMWLVACSNNKKNDDNIIAPKPTKVVKKATQAIGDYHQSRTIEWLGANYTISTARTADKTLPLTEDESGNKYYDNKITIKITRADGSVFLEKTFQKSDFKAHLTGTYARTGALLGVVFNKAKGNNLYFAASVGSPDSMSDDFVPIVVRISNMGTTTMYEDTQLDTEAGDSEDENNTETNDQYEEDGV